MERVRQITRVNEAHKLGYNGNNVTVAVMDTGIGTHIDFGQRIRGFPDTRRRSLLSKPGSFFLPDFFFATYVKRRIPLWIFIRKSIRLILFM